MKKIRYYGRYREVPLSALEPKGTLRNILIREKNGLPGHLNEIGYPFDLEPWKSKEPVKTEFNRWWPYEQTAYWVDSLTRTAMLLKDDELFAKVEGQIRQALKDADPYIGPNIIRAQSPCCRWPHSVFFRALYALYSGRGEEEVMEKMYRHYLGDMALDYGWDRTVMGTEMMMRVAEHFDDAELMKKAKKSLDSYLSCYRPALSYFHAYRRGLPESLNPNKDTGDMFSDLRCVFHGVSYNETAKLPAILYLYTGDRRYLEDSLEAYRVIEDRHMLPDGVNSSGEFLQGDDSHAVHESCDISDYTWSMGILLEATGEGRFADKIEKAIWNAYFGAQDKDYHAFQYFSAVNQVIATANSCYLNGFLDEKQSYQPLHVPQCCAGNLGRAFPNYVLRMYQETEQGVAVSLFGDCDYHGKSMIVKQSGDYPFSDRVELKITLLEARRNELRVRLPGWSASNRLTVNGRSRRYRVEDGYAVLRVKDGDCVVLETEKRFESHSSSDGGVYFTYGPFLMALKIEEDRRPDTEIARTTPEYPGYNITPVSPWNYAVSGFEKPMVIRPFSPENHVAEIEIEARELKGWKLLSQKDKNGQTHTFTPPLPGADYVRSHLGKKKKITLVPYGTTNLRLTVFPKFGDFGWFLFDVPWDPSMG